MQSVQEGGVALVQAFAAFALRALEEGCEEEMWEIMENERFHLNCIPLREPAALGVREDDKHMLLVNNVN